MSVYRVGKVVGGLKTAGRRICGFSVGVCEGLENVRNVSVWAWLRGLKCGEVDLRLESVGKIDS